MNNYLSHEENLSINRKYTTERIYDDIMNLRNINLQKLQPWIKVNYKKKKKYPKTKKQSSYRRDP